MSTCYTPGCTAPEGADHSTLHRTSTDALLTGFAKLTHQIESCRRTGTDQAVVAASEFRAQRELIRAEIIRRTEVRTAVEATHIWRGVPPQGSAVPDQLLPRWSEERGCTVETARAWLTEHYGADWTLEVQTTTVSDWEPVS